MCVIVIVTILVAIIGRIIFNECRHNSEIVAAYSEAEELITNNDYDTALAKLKGIEADEYRDTIDLIELCNAYIAYEAGNVKLAYWTIDSLNLKFATQQQREKLDTFIVKVEQEYETCLEEERIEEQKAYEDMIRNGIPFVGMSEIEIGNTSLGIPSPNIRHNNECISGEQYEANLYDFKNVEGTIFTARCVQGYVTEVWDYRDNPQKPYKPSYSESNKDDKEDYYDVYEYNDPEDFYYDNYDDFDGYEDAEDYWDDAWD